MEIPEGWKLVPIKSSGKMDEAGQQSLSCHKFVSQSRISNIYDAMIADAPAPPGKDGSVWTTILTIHLA